MTVAIDLDGKAGFGAEEVDNESTNGLLAAKPVARELVRAQALPEFALRRCQIAS